jgi:hypothetical protein
MTEHERKKLCRVMDCQRLSLEACLHAAQNERLPLRVVVQVNRSSHTVDWNHFECALELSFNLMAV